jgi:hypothetical protein
MNVEVGAEAALFPEKEYINGIFVAVHKLCITYTQIFQAKPGWTKIMQKPIYQKKDLQQMAGTPAHLLSFIKIKIYIGRHGGR